MQICKLTFSLISFEVNSIMVITLFFWRCIFCLPAQPIDLSSWFGSSSSENKHINLHYIFCTLMRMQFIGSSNIWAEEGEIDIIFLHFYITSAQNQLLFVNIILIIPIIILTLHLRFRYLMFDLLNVYWNFNSLVSYPICISKTNKETKFGFCGVE